MQLSSILEALLIASQDPLSSDDLSELIHSRVKEAIETFNQETEEGIFPHPVPEWLLKLAQICKDDIVEAISILTREYQETGRAFSIVERPKGWKIYTCAEYSDFVKHLFPDKKAERLSGPAMETLAIIAYRQPITKAAIEAVRGVSCDGMVQKLLDRDLIRTSGRADLPGRPLLYQTTDFFFEHFGINQINDLPNVSELRRMKLPESPETNSQRTNTQTQLPLLSTNED